MGAEWDGAVPSCVWFTSVGAESSQRANICFRCGMAVSGKIGRTERLQLDDVSGREPVML